MYTLPAQAVALFAEFFQHWSSIHAAPVCVASTISQSIPVQTQRLYSPLLLYTCTKKETPLDSRPSLSPQIPWLLDRFFWAATAFSARSIWDFLFCLFSCCRKVSYRNV